MKTLLSLCFVVLSAFSFSQEQGWKKAEFGKIPEGLKEANATLVFIIFDNQDIKEYGLHPKFTNELHNKFVKKYAEKSYSGTIEYMSMHEYLAKKDEVDYVFLPVVYESGRPEGVAPRLFGVFDVKNETVYTKIDCSGSYVAASSMQTEVKLEISFIEKKRQGK